MDKQKTVLVSVIAVAVLGAVLWYYYAKKSAALNLQSAATQGVLPSIGTNPLTNKPDINPTSRTNPFDSVKTNPFD